MNGNYITEVEKHIETAGEYDVIVAGSGPSGFAAAVTAARNGAKTLIIEYQGSIGGISTSGLMSHFTGRVESSLYSEILDRSYERNLFDGYDKIKIDPELLKNTYLGMLKKAGVDILLYTLACDVIKKDNRVCGVITESKSGRLAYLCKVLIDGTGDGDMAYRAGAEYYKGRESDGKMQPATLMFKVGGVDMSRAALPPSFETTIQTDNGELQALAKELLPFPAGHVLLYSSPIPGIVTCNMTNCIDVDGTKAEDLTRAEIVCRSQMEPIVKFLREYVPGFEKCYIVSAASMIGIRETRHFIGLKQITEKDILEARQFDDWVVRDAWFSLDVHNLTGASLDKTGIQKYFTQQNGYTIPYGCLVPKSIDGILLTGRNISGTHMAHSSFRAMPICVGIGEACGVAAAISTKEHSNLRNIKPGRIQEILLQNQHLNEH